MEKFDFDEDIENKYYVQTKISYEPGKRVIERYSNLYRVYNFKYLSVFWTKIVYGQKYEENFGGFCIRMMHRLCTYSNIHR